MDNKKVIKNEILRVIRLRRRPWALPVDAVGHSLWRRTMNADPTAKSSLCPWVNAMADSATGG